MKSIILFFSFFIIDIALCIIFEKMNAITLFLPAIFLEIAIFGSFIIYEIAKQGEKQNEEKQEDKKDD